jgi:hypothetical protein
VLKNGARVKQNPSQESVTWRVLMTLRSERPRAPSPSRFTMSAQCAIAVMMIAIFPIESLVEDNER